MCILCLLPLSRIICNCRFFLRCLFVLSISNFAQKVLNRFAWNFQGRLAMGHWMNDYILVVIQITVWIRYRDCFPGSSLLGDMESGINRLLWATLQCTLCTSRHRHSNYDIITSPDIGGDMHCPRASSYMLYYCNMVRWTWWDWSLILRMTTSFSALTLLVGL